MSEDQRMLHSTGRRRIPALLVALVVLLVGCGDDGAATTSIGSAASTAPSEAPATTTTLETTTVPAPTSLPASTSVSTEPSTTTTSTASEPVGGFELTSPAFGDGAGIPIVYTCDGENISPPLEWGANPAGTGSVALLVDDPDAGTEAWVHWVIFNIPPDVTSLPEGIPGGPANTVLSDGSMQGLNDFGVLQIPDFNHNGWDGPCPPDSHHYVFRLAALDTMLDLPSSATLADVEAAMEGHVIAESELVGRYPTD